MCWQNWAPLPDYVPYGDLRVTVIKCSCVAPSECSDDIAYFRQGDFLSRYALQNTILIC